MQSKEWKKPGLWLGDLNVAHLEKDVWNYGAKHLLKQAGCTLEERDSFDLLLKGELSQENHDGGNEYRDVFRHLHPDASGHYSYWSQRAGNRLPNKGLRLDYFVAHKTMFDDAKANDEISSQQSASKVFVRDSYMLPNVMGSDHCPCVLELELLD
jgi:exodeoxyribonuclease III